MNYQAQIGARLGKGSQRFPLAVGAAVLVAVVLTLACILSLTATGFVAPAGSPLRPPVVVAAPAGAGAVVRIGDGTTSRYEVAASELVTVPVEVVDVANLGAATVLLSYDPTVVHAVGCAGPQSGDFDGGACNTDYDLGVVRFNVIALEGVAGTHRLYDITFQAVGGDGATVTDLTLTVEYFADPQGNDLAVDTAGGQIEIIGEPLPPDAVVRVGDEHQSVFTLVPGESIAISVTLSITGTRRLGTATILLRYDPQVVRPTMCTRVDLIDGYCNPNFDPQAGLVKLNIVSADGLVGELHPYDVTFEVRSGVPVEAVSPLVLIVEHFADPLGSSMSWQAVNGSITVAAGPSNSARVLVGAPAETGTYTVAHGVTETVSIWVTDVVDLGAATIALDYDPAVVRALSCTVQNGPSGIDGGICALHDGQVRVSIISAQGVNGTARLFDVDFTPAPGVLVGVTSPVALTVEYFADTAAEPVPSRVRNGSIEVAAGGDGQAMALVRVGDNGGTFHLPLDGRVAVPIRVEGASGLGAATISLRYDPAVVQPVSCTPGDPVFDGGFCNPRAGDGLARLNVVSLNGFTGDTTLFELTFQPTGGATEGDQTDLSLTVTYFASPSGEPLLYQTAPGTIDIVAPIGTPDVVLRAGDALYQIAVGEQVLVPVSASIDAEATLGVATLVLDYDPVVVRPLACTLNDDAAGDGFDGGGCNLNYADGQIKFNALSLAGVTGETTIVEIEFQAIGQGGDITPLTPTVEHLADAAANALTYRAQAGSIGIPPVDGNGDGIPDSQQVNVISVRNAVDGRFVTLVSPDGTILQDVSAMGNPSPQDTPAGVDFPVGFFAFGVQGIGGTGEVTVTLFLPAEMDIVQYFKYGPTSDDPTQHWYEFDFDGRTTGAEIQPDRVILHFVDGQRGDGDLVANGKIADPGGPAVCSPASGLAVNFVTAEPADLRQGAVGTGGSGRWKGENGESRGERRDEFRSPSSILQSPSSIILTARVSNVGSVSVPAGTTVDFYLGDPNAGGSPIGTATTVQPLGAGEFEDVGVTWAGAAEGDHQLFIVADDPAPGLIAECSAGSVTRQTVSILDVPLVESWNLMSTYVNPFNTDTSLVQRPIEGQYVVIQGFDGGAQSYYPDLPPAVNTLKSIDGEHGYWVKVKPGGGQHGAESREQGARSREQGAGSGAAAVGGRQSAVVTPVATWRFVGTKLAEERPIELEAGWNLVSFLPRQPLPVADALQSIDGQYFAVLGFDQGALSYYPDLDPSFNTLTVLEPLHGYWIKMNQAGTLQYPVTTQGHSKELRGTEGTASARPMSSSEFLRVPTSPTWVNFYGPTSLPAGTLIQAVDPDGVVCGAAEVHAAGKYGLLACYGDDPTTSMDEGAQSGDTVRLVVNGQTLGTGTWTAHGDLLEVNLGDRPVRQSWQLYLPLLPRGNR